MDFGLLASAMELVVGLATEDLDRRADIVALAVVAMAAL